MRRSRLNAPTPNASTGAQLRLATTPRATARSVCMMPTAICGSGHPPSFPAIRVSSPTHIPNIRNRGLTATIVCRAADRGSARRRCYARASAIFTDATSAKPSLGCAVRATRDEATLAQAIACYHELCNDPELAGPRVVAGFAQAQRDAGLTFGGTVQCRSLRPAFITAKRLELLRAAVSALWSAFARLESKTISDPSFAAELGLSAAERDLITIDPGYADATVISRLDTFFCATPRVLEYNADSPAGMSYQAGQASLMSRLPVFERFATDYELEPLRADIALRETLLGVWREFTARRGANGVLPRIAILDLANAATGPEFRLIARDFERHGISTIIT